MLPLYLVFFWGCESIEHKEIQNESNEIVVENKKAPIYESSQMVTHIHDIFVLQQLKETYSLSKVLPLSSEEILLVENNKEMWDKNENYRLLMQHLGERIDDIAKNQIKRPLVRELHEALTFPAGNVGRYFDSRWLSSSSGFFQLIGVVNRLDKQDFYSDGRCGDIRFVYRLAYSQEGVRSRLPFTMNVVWRPKTKECSKVARMWVKSNNKDTDPDLFSDPKWIQEHLLSPERFEFEKIEVNLQLIRFPSGLETEFAGQALYLLRVYGFEQEKERWVLKEQGLENTPDVQRIATDPILYDQLLTFVQDHVEDIDNGSYLLPENLWAKEVISYSTLGINRMANRPFSVIQRNSGSLLDDLKKLEVSWNTQRKLKNARWVKSAESVVDRLNNGSCQGCHQASSTAGFHFLGDEDETINGITNRLQIPFSSHFLEDQKRRQKYLAQLASEQEVDVFRPHSLFRSVERQVNDVCIPPEWETHFADTSAFQCPEDTVCLVISKDPTSGLQYGSCISKEENIRAGESCIDVVLSGEIEEEGSLYNLHNYDRTLEQKQRYSISSNKRFTESSYNCRPTRIGVPLGRTYRRCTKSERQFGGFLQPDGSLQEEIPKEICAVVGGRKFDACVEKDFHSCLSSIVARGMVDSCSLDDFCREDYICQVVPYQLKGVDQGIVLEREGIGFCTPTYFMFQLRLDGHPVPI
jgi:hypothetical protein